MNVLYAEPLKDWSPIADVAFFPEAPGDYRLVVEWRSPRGGQGRVERGVAVDAGAALSVEPRAVEVGGLGGMWAPSEWEAGLLEQSERAALDELGRLVRPGWQVIDVGANLGLYAMTLSRMVGPTGRVLCLEPNPVCVYFLRLNLARSHAANCTVLPLAASDTASTVDIKINYGNSNLGLSTDSPHYGGKAGQRLLVPALPLDEVLERFAIRPPDFVKIDVEGAEGAVIHGMGELLARRRPLLLVEIHGLGPASSVLPFLDRLGYAFRVAGGSPGLADGGAFLRGMTDAVIQVFCHPDRAAS
jgi:FkbM family methyltransferase